MGFQLFEEKYIADFDSLLGILGVYKIKRSPTACDLLKRVKEAGCEKRLLSMLEKKQTHVSIEEEYMMDAWFAEDLGTYLVCHYDLILDKLGLLKPDEPLFDFVKAAKMAEKKYQSLCNLSKRVDEPFSYKYSGECGSWKYIYDEDDEKYDNQVLYKGNLIIGINYPHIKYEDQKLTDPYIGRICRIIENIFEWEELIHSTGKIFLPLEHDMGTKWCLDD